MPLRKINIQATTKQKVMLYSKLSNISITMMWCRTDSGSPEQLQAVQHIHYHDVVQN